MHCEEPGCDFESTAANPSHGLTMHMVRVHGKKRNARRRKQALNAVARRTAISVNGPAFTQVSENFIILEASDGSIWLAERIK